MAKAVAQPQNQLIPDEPPVAVYQGPFPTALLADSPFKPSPQLVRHVTQNGVLEPLVFRLLEQSHDALTPATVQNRPYRIVSGKRRVGAAKLAQREFVPVIVFSAPAHVSDQYLVALNELRSENVGDEYHAVWDLVQAGHTTQQIAQAAGVVIHTIEKLRKLDGLIEGFRTALFEGRLPRFYYRIAKLKPRDQEKLLNIFLDKDGKLSADDIRQFEVAKGEGGQGMLGELNMEDESPNFGEIVSKVARAIRSERPKLQGSLTDPDLMICARAAIAEMARVVPDFAEAIQAAIDASTDSRDTPDTKRSRAGGKKASLPYKDTDDAEEIQPPVSLTLQDGGEASGKGRKSLRDIMFDTFPQRGEDVVEALRLAGVKSKKDLKGMAYTAAKGIPGLYVREAKVLRDNGLLAD